MRCTKRRIGWTSRKRSCSRYRFQLSTSFGGCMHRLLATLHLFSLLLVMSGFVVGQEKKSEQLPLPTPLVSPDIHPDGSVTFRFRAPNARDVNLDREGAEAVDMQKDDQGVWTVTTAPLAPDYYGYSFMADGVRS